jgi:hypothetical protein
VRGIDDPVQAVPAPGAIVAAVLVLAAAGAIAVARACSTVAG